MILEILRHTPIWVFGLFFALLALGLLLTRTRTASLLRLAIFPVVLMGLALFGVLSTSSASPAAVAMWMVVLVTVAVLVTALGIPRGTTYAPAAGTFTMPGSWFPLLFIMIIFFTRYAIAVALALHPSLRQTDAFAVCVGAVYGLSGGYFGGRVLTLVRLARKSKEQGAAAAL